jgi:hypothetical protein
MISKVSMIKRGGTHARTGGQAAFKAPVPEWSGAAFFPGEVNWPIRVIRG